MFKIVISYLNMDMCLGYMVDVINFGCREEMIFMMIFFLFLMFFQFKVEIFVEKDIYVYVFMILIVF